MQSITNKIEHRRNVQHTKKENGEIAISGRELHQALEVKTPYKKMV